VEGYALYKIREIRKLKNLTLGQLSLLAGVSKSYINDLENGIKQKPSYEVLIKISKALNVTIEELLTK
jgi:transcriptional regulator with XRE-family HTH domain